MDFAPIAAELSALTGARCAPRPARRVHGGSINECYAWPSATGPLFVKLGARAALEMFAAEAAGLAELAAAQALRVPRVLARGGTAASAFLALEWIEPGTGGEACERRLGEGLAALHRVSRTCFGWERDNTLGSTPQVNTAAANWAEFFSERRLRPQLELARAHGLAAQLGGAAAELLEAVPALLAGHAPAAALLHGDLWGGNWLASQAGEPVLFDPAVYYGDRETDLAMTRLFGGFGEAFYRAYLASAPLPGGWQTRVELYNLYHLLNHANLFGGTYLRAARSSIERLLRQARA